MKTTKYFLITLLICLGLCSVTQAQNSVGPWDLSTLYVAPDWEETDLDAVDGFTSILYKSIDYLGNPVEVYAYYNAPSGNMPVGGWPAVVYAHGGGGTASHTWVKQWNNRGYAAISMDLDGGTPSGESTSNPGPSQSGVFDDYELPIDEQWYYHAVAQAILGHSLIASFPEVDASKIGMIGTSWGGNITSTVMGVDNRLAWAIPVYGSGFLAESDGDQGQNITEGAKTEFVNANYDGSLFFENVTFPTLWINGTNDYSFSMPSNQKSSQATNGLAYLRYSLGFAHNNNAARSLGEVYAFADQVVNGGTSMTIFEEPEILSNTISVSYSSSVGLDSAELLYTMDGEDVIWREKIWLTMDATISGDIISASVPTNAYAMFFTGTDTRDLLLTSEYLLNTTEDSSLSNNEFEYNANKAIIYPNPVLSTATITGAANSRLNLYDMNGSLIVTQDISSESEIIDLNNLSAGVYYGQVNGSQSISVIKIVKE